VRQLYDGKLYPDIQVNTFRNIDRLFPTRTVARGKTVSTLPVSKRPLQDFSYTVDGETYDLCDVIKTADSSERILPEGWMAAASSRQVIGGGNVECAI